MKKRTKKTLVYSISKSAPIAFFPRFQSIINAGQLIFRESADSWKYNRLTAFGFRQNEDSVSSENEDTLPHFTYIVKNG